MNRRSLLKLMGFGAAAAPMTTVGNITSGSGLVGEAMSVGTLNGATSHLSEASTDCPSIGQSAKAFGDMRANYLRIFGRLPPHVEDRIRRQNATVQHLDPDIAAKKSWSMSVKVLTQRERNIQRGIAEECNDISVSSLLENFKNTMGFYWS